MAHGRELEQLYRDELGALADTAAGTKILVMVRAMCLSDQTGPGVAALSRQIDIEVARLTEQRTDRPATALDTIRDELAARRANDSA